MILTFDPAGLKSGYDCVEFLKQKGIVISQKLGARIIVLSSRKIQVSPVILEDSIPGSPLESFFLSGSLLSEVNSDNPGSLVEIASRFGLKEKMAAIIELGILKIISPLELENIEEKENSALPVLARSTSEFLGITSISPHSILSDRRYLEEMTLNFLDSEDPKVIVESMRKLTRIILMSSKDPGNLFREAFSKDNPQIWAASASIIKEMINFDLGLNLESFLKEKEIERKRVAFRIVLQDSLASPGSFLGEAVLQILIKLLREKEYFPLFTDQSERLAQLLKSYPRLIEEFIRNVFTQYYEYSPDELRMLRDFLYRIAREHHVIAQILLDELRKNNPGPYKILISWILSPLSLDESSEECMIAIMKTLIAENIKDQNLLGMTKTALLRLAPRSLSKLSEKSHYLALDTDIRLFILDLWEQYISQSDCSGDHIEDFIAILVYELNGNDVAAQRSLLRRKILTNPVILQRLKKRTFNRAALLEAAAFTFSSYQNIEDTPYIFSILQELVEDAPGMCLELLEKKHYLEEEIEDYIPFIGHLLGVSLKSSRISAKLLERATGFLNTLSREKKMHGYLAIEALGTIYEKVPWKKSKVSLFTKRVIKNSSLPFDIRIKTLRALYLSMNLTEKTRLSIEDYLLETLRAKKLRSPDLTYLLEELNTALNMGRNFVKTDDIIDIFGREIAFKLTQPTISEMMQSEAHELGPSKFMAQYEQNPWKWEDVSQALFILVKIYVDKSSAASRKQRILHIISYLVHHWSLSTAKKEKSSRFFLQDVVLFRILRDIIESVNPEHAHLVARMMSSILTLVIKGNDTLVMNGDLQYFLVGSCRLLKNGALSDGSIEFPFDIRKETVHFLLKAWQSGSKSAGELLNSSLDEDWLGDYERRLLSHYF